MISIIMPARNAAPYLSECIESILEQTYEDWELLVVNDHSTDTTNSILETFAVRDRRITVLQNKGKGIIPALKGAYSKAKGTFITRMDADDRMPQHKLAFMVGQLKECGEGHVATGKVSYFSEGKLGEGFINYEKWLNELAENGNQFTELFRECVIPSPCWMLHKTDFDAIGAFNSNTYPEDYDLVFRMYAHNLKPIPVSEVLHYWRDHKDRASRNDPNYADDTFSELKTDYFIKLHYQSEKKIQLWGAGRRGKKLAKELLKHEISFKWYCNNPNKIGKHIYDMLIEDFNELDFSDDSQVLITSNKKNFTTSLRLAKIVATKALNKDYFFFA